MKAIKASIRAFMRQIAMLLNTVSRGKLTPNAVTVSGFVMHAPIAVLIATGHNIWAAVLLVIFGLFDTLDGELARLQKRTSKRGMLLDASTDRMKEVLLYTGATYYLAMQQDPTAAAWATLACGASLCVSYVKAKGEAAVASGSQKIPHDKLNRMFSGGLLSFEIRMAILVIALLANKLMIALPIIAILAGFTAFQRLFRITKQLG